MAHKLETNLDTLDFKKYYISKAINPNNDLKKKICNAIFPVSLDSRENLFKNKNSFLKKMFDDLFLQNIQKCKDSLILLDSLIHRSSSKKIYYVSKKELGNFYKTEIARITGALYQAGSSLDNSQKITLSGQFMESKKLHYIVTGIKVLSDCGMIDDADKSIQNMVNAFDLFFNFSQNIKLFVESNNKYIKKHIENKLMNIGFQISKSKSSSNYILLIQNDFLLSKILFFNRIKHLINLRIVKNSKKENDKGDESSDKKNELGFEINDVALEQDYKIKYNRLAMSNALSFKDKSNGNKKNLNLIWMSIKKDIFQGTSEDYCLKESEGNCKFVFKNDFWSRKRI